MQNTQTNLNEVIKKIVLELKKQNLVSGQDLDSYMDKQIITKLGSFATKSDKIFSELKQVLFDTNLRSAYKLLVIIYAALLFGQNQLSSGLLSFYYQFASYALKELKQGPVEKEELWSALFEKIYYFGMLLLTGNRTLLLSMQTFGMRINSQLLTSKAQTNKMSKLVRIYNCIISIPEEFLTLNQVLSLTLIFTRWNISQNDPFSPSFFASFQRRTQKKLIRKLNKYQKISFTQEHLLNLVKIVLSGEQLLFSYFLQAKFLYENSKQESSKGKERAAIQGLQKAIILKEGKRLFNLILKLLLQAPQEALGSLERQSIIYIALKCLSGKFENNEELFQILITRFMHQKNEIVSIMAFRIIREEALIYLTVYKLKLLLNLFNVSSWKTLIAKGITQSTIFDRLQKTIELLNALGRRYSDENLNLRCEPDRYSLSVQSVRQVKSIVFVVVFDMIGRLSEPANRQFCLLRLNIDRNVVIDVIVSFSQNSERFSVESTKESRERTATVIIRQGQRDIVEEKKQYLRFGQGNYQSLVTVSLGGKDNRLLNISIDGAFYDLNLDKKSQIKGLQVGYCNGCIRSFYALNCQLQLIQLYKKWCECERKTKYIVESYGFDKYCYKLNNHQEPPLLQLEQPKWGFFKSKTQIKVVSPIKQHKIIDTYLQLGGLETIFFVLQRLTRSFQELEGCEQKIVELLKQFLQMLRLTAYLDEKHAFLDDILKCFKFINPFLFLLIKRNTIIREAEDSRLLLSFFQMIVYFQRDKKIVIEPETEMKMRKIETMLVINTFANFQLWSNCSVNIQLFVLSLIQSYISNGKTVIQLIRRDLHKELLSSIVLFSTSENYLPDYQTVQTKLAEVCLALYVNIQKQYAMISSVKGVNMDDSGQKTELFFDRDIKLVIALLKSLSQRVADRAFSESQFSAFQVLVRYLIKNFLKSQFVYKIVSKNWPLYLKLICSIAKSPFQLGGDIASFLSSIIMKYVQKQSNCDEWVVIFMDHYAESKKSSIIDYMKVVHSMTERYEFSTPGKTIILDKIIKNMESKLTKIDQQQIQKIRIDILDEFNKLSPRCLFRLSCQKEYLVFMEELRFKYFESELDFKVWRSINTLLLDLLIKKGRIISQNSLFIKFLLINIYERDRNHPLAVSHLTITFQTVYQLESLVGSQKNSQNKEYVRDVCHSYGAYALIEHCRGWLALYYLFQQGLLTGNGDLPLPFDQSDIDEQESPGGAIAYYLSGKCDIPELYLLLNVILYRQLGNSLTFLSTLAPVSIYQKMLLKICDLSENQHQQGYIALIVLLMRNVINSLNRGYALKAGTMCKELQKILGSQKDKKKGGDSLQSLYKACKCIEQSFEATSNSQSLSSLMQVVLNKIKLINEQQEQSQHIKVLLHLGQQLNKVKEGVFSKLNIISSRFFQVARQYWLLNPPIMVQIPVNSQKITELKHKQEQNLTVFWQQLDFRYQSILNQFNERGFMNEKNWKKLLKSNEHWFQLQGNLDDLTTTFYELDQKEIGPFGFYKLNIRPVKTEVRKLPYPRRKQYKQIIEEKEEEQRQKQNPTDVSLSIQTSTYFASVNELSRIQNYELSLRKQTSIRVQNQKQNKREWWCEWVTKRGVYAGRLKKKGKMIEFKFTSHSQLPNDVIYQESTNRCHWIQKLNEWQEQQMSKTLIPFSNCQIFTRRYILRHTAFQMFSHHAHKSYFFNLFHQKQLRIFLQCFKGQKVDLIVNRRQEFQQRQFTSRWQKGQLTNFQYLCLVNRYSGRTTNDLAQYPIMPWVLVNYKEKDTEKDNYMKFLTKKQNLRDLSLPTGKLNMDKFQKLKMRLNQIDPNDIEIRFLYGTMYSNPTILYNFFIRLEPFTSLHWEHQGRKIDHADRLFSAVADQYSTVLSSSSDNKELCPQFYYWPEFLRNRNLIELGRKQKGEQVHSVVLPPWAKTPEQFIFKMRQVLQSKYVSDNLHNWIDLVFGYKAPYEVAEEHDNLFHYQCYEHDIFTYYESERERKTAQIAISEFGQVPETIFYQKHLQRVARKDIEIDKMITLQKPTKSFTPHKFQLNDAGIIIWSNNQIVFKKSAIQGRYETFEWNHEYQSHGQCYLLSININRWITLESGLLRLFEKKKLKEKCLMDAQCLEVVGEYLLVAVGSKIQIIKMVKDLFQPVIHLFGHHSEIIMIKTDPVLDLIISVDRSGLVLVHELTVLRFFRAFHLGVNFQDRDIQKLKVCIHQMGYFIFLDHEQTIYIFNLLGQQLLQQQMEIKSDYNNNNEVITDIQLMSHHQPIILGSTSKGNIYLMNFLEIIRFKELYAYKNYSRFSKNILSSVPKRSNNAIRQFQFIHSRGDSQTIYQLIVLYDDGEVTCFIQNRQMGRQLKDNDRLKYMGIV